MFITNTFMIFVTKYSSFFSTFEKTPKIKHFYKVIKDVIKGVCPITFPNLVEIGLLPLVWLASCMGLKVHIFVCFKTKIVLGFSYLNFPGKIYGKRREGGIDASSNGVYISNTHTSSHPCKGRTKKRA